MEQTRTAKVAICDTQPVTAEGLKAVVAICPDLAWAGGVNSLPLGLSLARGHQPEIMVVDKSFGMQAVLEWLTEMKVWSQSLGVVVWGGSVTEAEALRFLQAGAKGMLRKTASVETVLACLRSIAAGKTWMEDGVFRDSQRVSTGPRSELTPREQQVMELIEQGLKNKEIARELGIRPGTVKIHLKHIFEKTGVRGRYGLALTGMKEKGLLALPRM
jgi:two-component system nitrate/nitrite response regulator NarL